MDGKKDKHPGLSEIVLVKTNIQSILGGRSLVDGFDKTTEGKCLSLIYMG